MSRSLRELAEELLALGRAEFLAKHTRPVLLCREGSDAEDRAFHTVRGEIPDLSEAPASPTEPPKPSGWAPPPTRPMLPVMDELPTLEGTRVYAIRKRAGGAFKDRIGLGRAPNVDISIPLPRLSKYHAYLCVPADPEAPVTLTDAGSKNGTWVDGAPVGKTDEVPLVDGCTVRLGPYFLTFHTPEGLLERLEREPVG